MSADNFVHPHLLQGPSGTFSPMGQIVRVDEPVQGEFNLLVRNNKTNYFLPISVNGGQLGAQEARFLAPGMAIYSQVESPQPSEALKDVSIQLYNGRLFITPPQI